MKTAVSILALCAFAGAANAAATFTSFTANYAIGGPSAPGAAAVSGDTVNAAVTGFNAGGGGFLNGPISHTVGGVDVGPSVAPGLVADFVYESFVTDSGSTRTIDFFIYADGASAPFLNALASPGLIIAGAPVIDIFFELPDLNGGPDLFDDLDKVGAATGTFDLIGTVDGVSPTILFGAAAGITDLGTSFSVGNGVGAGGIDLFDPAALGATITGAQFSISYEIVPAPASAGLLGLGALAATRRRRS